MKDCKFKQLILDVYKEWKKPSRTFIKKEFGGKFTYNNFYGVLYGAISRVSFMDIEQRDDISKEIENIEGMKDFLDNTYPNMLCLISRVDEKELQIYDSDLIDYKIEGDILKLTLKDKKGIEFKL